MPPRPTNWRLWGKMAAAGALCCIGGPALVYYVSPTEEELFLKYNPDLQKRSLENRAGKEQNFDDFVGKLKEYSRSDKPIWEAAAIAEKKSRDGKIAEQVKLSEEIEARKKEIRNAGIKPMPGGSL
ncbi:CBP4-domain-containing protein [Hyaloscypha bicolor E]|uniref:Cytochrome b mRNA-processing protein 4 n=1 Tax=Hyaloscypha bicolor E TaxID=1095630 RepID=A0A2J6TCT9_9HELO|nr:CBP4-domain-containing protein [Hyaloscypha bicolor E]PMD60854.1 CBP4-domain-containing protein [Hyaloscypha bicolor E]